MDSLNRSAIELVDEALDFAGELDIRPYELDSGATVVDFGVEADGGIEAGLFLAEIQTAGLASVHTSMERLGGAPRPYVELTTDHPALSLLGSQKAGWELDFEGFDGLGSGPARAIVAEEAEFAELDYVDEFEFTVLAIESVDLPTDQIAAHVAEMAGVEPHAVYLPTYAAGSMAGSVSMAARAAELAVFRLFELGYPLGAIETAAGTAPIAPVTYDESVALGRTNDAIVYGGEVYLQVTEPSPVFEELPSSAGDEYGRPFEAIFESVEWDFYDVPESVFAPGQVTIDVIGGETITVGETDEELLCESFGIVQQTG